LKPGRVPKTSSLDRSRPKLNTLQMGRGLAALCVLLYHTNITLSSPKYLGRNAFRVFDFGDSGVHFFFVLSGFVIFLAHETDLGKSSKVLEFLWKRFRRVYPNLWAVLLLLMPVFFLLPSLVAMPPLYVTISAFLISPTTSEILPQEWSLRREVLFYAICAIAIWRRQLGTGIAIAWLAASVAVSLYGIKTYPWVFMFSSYNLLFLFGVLSSIVFTHNFKIWPRTLAVIGVCTFLGTWAAQFLGMPKGALGDWAFGLGAALSIVGLATLEREDRFRVPRLMVVLGEASYSIYLVHWIVISAMCKFVTRFERSIPLELVFLEIASFALMGGIMFHFVIEKRLTAIGRIDLARTQSNHGVRVS
jgi:exopolysaccharide production protein ExoZ